MLNSSLFASAASCSVNVPSDNASRSSVILSICPCRLVWLSSHSEPACFADSIISCTDCLYAVIAATAPPVAKEAIPTGDVKAESSPVQLDAIVLIIFAPPITPKEDNAPWNNPRLSTTCAIAVAKSRIPSIASSGSASE